jgi:hypothetical protein
MPGNRPAIAADLAAYELSPERALLAAMFRMAVTDARSQGQHPALQARRLSAQAWLRNEPLVRWWLTLAGLPEWTYHALLCEAGLKKEDS